MGGLDTDNTETNIFGQDLKAGLYRLRKSCQDKITVDTGSNMILLSQPRLPTVRSRVSNVSACLSKDRLTCWDFLNIFNKFERISTFPARREDLNILKMARVKSWDLVLTLILVETDIVDCQDLHA